jgi:uncharacterized integral membrane protein
MEDYDDGFLSNGIGYDDDEETTWTSIIVKIILLGLFAVFLICTEGKHV